MRETLAIFWHMKYILVKNDKENDKKKGEEKW